MVVVVVVVLSSRGSLSSSTLTTDRIPDHITDHATDGPLLVPSRRHGDPSNFRASKADVDEYKASP